MDCTFSLFLYFHFHFGVHPVLQFLSLQILMNFFILLGITKSLSPLLGFSTSGSSGDFLKRFWKTLLIQIKNFLRKIFNREIQKKKILRKRKAGKPSYRKASLIEAGSLINLRSFKTIFPFFHFFFLRSDHRVQQFYMY